MENPREKAILDTLKAMAERNDLSNDSFKRVCELKSELVPLAKCGQAFYLDKILSSNFTSMLTKEELDSNTNENYKPITDYAWRLIEALGYKVTIKTPTRSYNLFFNLTLTKTKAKAKELAWAMTPHFTILIEKDDFKCMYAADGNGKKRWLDKAYIDADETERRRLDAFAKRQEAFRKSARRIKAMEEAEMRNHW